MTMLYSSLSRFFLVVVEGVLITIIIILSSFVFVAYRSYAPILLSAGILLLHAVCAAVRQPGGIGRVQSKHHTAISRGVSDRREWWDSAVYRFCCGIV